jgi:hypothetical protein
VNGRYRIVNGILELFLVTVIVVGQTCQRYANQFKDFPQYCIGQGVFVTDFLENPWPTTKQYGYAYDLH